MDTRTATAVAAGALAGAGAVIAAAAGWVWLACRAAAEDEHLTTASSAYWRARQAHRHAPEITDLMVQPALVDNVLAHAGFCRRPGCDYGRVLTDSGQRCDLHAVPDPPAEHDADPAPETISDCDDLWCEYGLPGWLTGPERQLCDRHDVVDAFVHDETCTGAIPCRCGLAPGEPCPRCGGDPAVLPYHLLCVNHRPGPTVDDL